MRDVYKNLKRVVIWLGPGTPKSKAAFQFLRSVQPSGFRVDLSGSEDVGLLESRLMELRRLLELDAEAREAVKFYFQDVATRAWWKRVWIVQEAALASELVVKCGDDNIPWGDMMGIVMDLLRCRDAMIKDMMDTTSTQASEPWCAPVVDIFNVTRRLVEIDSIHNMEQSGTHLQISDLVTCFRAFSATDPKDMIYGFLGLSSNNPHKLLSPKYSPSVHYMEVFTDLVENSILESQSLDIITLSQFTDSRPTWVPDWTKYSEALSSNNFEHLPAKPLIKKFINMAYLKTACEGIGTWC